jgi:hypothetical protein
LAQFGITVSKSSKPLTPSQKLIRAAKALKTRALRHTMGKVQKAAARFTGDLQVAVNETTPCGPRGPDCSGCGPPTMQVTAVASTRAVTPVAVNHTQ